MPVAAPAARRIAISLGDPSGIGPEVTAMALARADVRAQVEPLLFGDAGVWERACRDAKVEVPLQVVTEGDPLPPHGGVLVATTALGSRQALPGKPDLPGAHAQFGWLKAAAAAVQKGEARALCTAPLSKAQVNLTGLPFTGHTEWLAEQTGREVLMMLAGSRLRVALATTHLPLSAVPAALTTEGLTAQLLLLHRELGRWFGIKQPRIAVCGLNPHAGESGHLGREEIEVIAPAIKAARRRKVDATGPFPADGLFPRAVDGGFDAVLAMFHDQGLVALKLLHATDGVNVTLGLPWLRTSPDHGTAYDLAGTGRADPTSMANALLQAAAH